VISGNPLWVAIGITILTLATATVTILGAWSAVTKTKKDDRWHIHLRNWVFKALMIAIELQHQVRKSGLFKKRK